MTEKQYKRLSKKLTNLMQKKRIYEDYAILKDAKNLHDLKQNIASLEMLLSLYEKQKKC